ncbi:transglycosylase SLT domain-containing protein [Kitasatospora sp. NBC_00240]|uniref:transglycosylase SLT domain-containing protein n=1 Tax=Kitasatospora sp. NBC_00240 TaxID=2903567 RepID=UPI002B1DA950|nr:transglycosylase SLT domain-containing protein [Kitasatospora sp. NBC_00240]
MPKHARPRRIPTTLLSGRWMTTAALAGAAVAVAAANATPSHGSDPSPVTATSPQATQLEPTTWSTPTSAHHAAVAGHSSSAPRAQRTALPTQRTSAIPVQRTSAIPAQRTSAIPAQRAALPPQRGTDTGTARAAAATSPAAHPSATPSRTAGTWAAGHPATAASGTPAPATAPAAVTSAPTAAASAHATSDSGAATHSWTGESGSTHTWTGASGSTHTWTGASGGGTWQATGQYANAGGSTRPAAQATPAPGQASPAQAVTTQAPTTQATGDLDTWIKDALVVMADNHIPGSYDGIYRNIMRESSGNPQAINLTDSNAAAGHPSKGLLQVIDPTFQAYHVPGTSMDIYDPVANITAACNYAADFYGSIDNVDGPY